MADTVLDQKTQDKLNHLRKIADIRDSTLVSYEAATAAVDTKFQMNDDAKEARAIQAAANAYKAASNDYGIWFKSLLGGPSNATAAHDAAITAAKAQGAGPNDVPNLVQAAEKIAKAQK